MASSKEQPILPVRIPNPMVAAESVDWLGQLLTETRNIQGAVVEAGCHNGLTSIYLQSVLCATGDPRTLHCYDLWGPLSAGSMAQAGYASASLDQWKMLFGRFRVPMPVAHVGWFNDTMPKELPESISFAFLDGDFYESILVSLGAVLPRMTKGGYIVIHDWVHAVWGKQVQEATHKVWRGKVGFDKGLALIQL